MAWTVTAGIAGGIAVLGLALFVQSGASEPVAVLRADPGTVYDPVEAGEELPRDFRQVLSRDQIEPVYEAEFTSLDGVDWPEDSLVIGVASGGEAKAYPVTFLNQREMVNDDIDGWPILVTW